jgi:hypothetical protein
MQIISPWHRQPSRRDWLGTMFTSALPLEVEIMATRPSLRDTDHSLDQRGAIYVLERAARLAHAWLAPEQSEHQAFT